VKLPFSLKAPAKINLRLRVDGVGDAGLHRIHSMMADLGLSDEIRFEDTSDGFCVECDPPLVPERENLAWRAPMSLQSPLPQVRINVLKRIPLEAGLGGGSSDAAAALRGIAMIMEARGEPVTPQAMLEAASRTGADVPACLCEGLKVVEGYGERVRPLDCRLPPWSIVLLRCGAGVLTARAYALLDDDRSRVADSSNPADVARDDEAIEGMRHALDSCDFSQFRSLLHNDFTDVVERAYPHIARARRRLEGLGAQATLLCGSGSCVAGFYERTAGASAAVQALAGASGCWSALTAFAPAGAAV